MYKDQTPTLPNPDSRPEDWIDYAACATAEFSFDGFPEAKSRKSAFGYKHVATAASICADCVVFSQCLEELQDTRRTDRNTGSVQAGHFVGKNGGLFNLLDQ